MTFDGAGPLYETQYKPSNVTTVEGWFKVDPRCPEGAIVFDKLVESDRSAFRLEIGKNSLRLVNTAGDVTEAPLPAGGDLLHVVCVVDKDTDSKTDPAKKTQRLYLNGTLAGTTPFSNALAVSRQEGPLRIGGDLAGQHRFRGSIERISVYSRPPKDNELAAGPEVSKDLAAKLGWGETARWDFAAKPSEDGTIPSVGTGPALSVARPFLPATVPAPDKGLSLRYGHPAWEWVQALPIGNGRLGGMGLRRG